MQMDYQGVASYRNSEAAPRAGARGVGCERSVRPAAIARSATGALAGALFVLLLLAPPAQAAKNCGDMPDQHAYQIKVKKTGCGKGRKIVKKWNRNTSARFVKNFRCTYRDTGFHEGKIKCRNGEKRVRWVTAS